MPCPSLFKIIPFSLLIKLQEPGEGKLAVPVKPRLKLTILNLAVDLAVSLQPHLLPGQNLRGPVIKQYDDPRV